MNMQPADERPRRSVAPSGRCRRWPFVLTLTSCWLLLPLAGCGLEGNSTSQTHLETELYANDDMVQTLRRLFFPAAYWQEKSDLLQEQVKKHQEAFHERTKAYHTLLEKRRKQVGEAIAQAKTAGKGGDEARKEVIQAFRAALDPVREEARQLGKTLRRLMMLQAQAEMAARQ